MRGGLRIPGSKLRLIGPLQTNKARDAVALFDCIETVDRHGLADALAKEMAKQGRNLPCFIQVNTGEEEQKGGVAPDGLPALLEHAARRGSITGLMCIPPVDEPPGPHFALLKKLSVRHGLRDLSMGMSADYEEGVALGATFVRVGTGVFGARVYSFQSPSPNHQNVSEFSDGSMTRCDELYAKCLTTHTAPTKV